MRSTRDVAGSVIVVNGASSAGKSTLVAAVQPLLPRPFVAHGLDLYFFTAFLPRDGRGVVRDWPMLRPRVVDGFHRSLRGFADAGVDVLCDVVLDEPLRARIVANGRRNHARFRWADCAQAALEEMKT